MVTLNVVDGMIYVSVKEEIHVVKYDVEVYTILCTFADTANDADTIEEYEAIVKGLFDRLQSFSIVSANNVISTECPYIKYDTLKKEYYLVYRDEVSEEVISPFPIPESLVERIMTAIDQGVSFLPVVKLWTRFLRNPNLKTKGRDFAEKFANFVNMKYVHPKMVEDFLNKGLSEEVANRLSTIYQIKITNEGLLNGYKVSCEILHAFDPESGEMVDRYKRTFNINTGEIESDGLPEHVEDRLFEPAVMGNRGDKFYCGSQLGHFIRVGEVHRLESWEQVNCDDDRSCVPGLHVGGLYYINSYGGEIHNVFVDPMHIGAIPDDDNGAIRCLQYFVHSSMAGLNRSMFHSSEYSKLTDLQWEEMRKEIMKMNADCVRECEKDNVFASKM